LTLLQFGCRIWEKDRSEQRKAVRVQLPREDLMRSGNLDDLAQVHDRDPVAYLFDSSEVMRYE